MPTLLLHDGFKFFFYANEHEPKHVHVMKGGDFAKIEIVSLKVVDDYMKPRRDGVFNLSHFSDVKRENVASWAG
jgi:hypothetical protein